MNRLISQLYIFKTGQMKNAFWGWYPHYNIVSVHVLYLETLVEYLETRNEV